MFSTEYDFHALFHRIREHAADEILPLKDPRVRSNEAYLTVILLSRVITRIGSIDNVTPAVIERLFAADLGYLQELYNGINQAEPEVPEPRGKRGQTTPDEVRGEDLEGGLRLHGRALEPAALGES